MTALLKPADAAARLAISTAQLRALTDRGDVRYVNVGAGGKREARRYDPADLDAFMEARRQCRSTADAAGTARSRRPTPTTSSIVAVDFRATPAPPRSG